MAEGDRSNPRKFRVWDAAILTQAMYDAAEIKNKLENVCNRESQNISGIKPTLIDSHMLYILADSYLEAYGALIKENLIQTSNTQPKRFRPTIH